jgi:hypothetical protein
MASAGVELFLGTAPGVEGGSVSIDSTAPGALPQTLTLYMNFVVGAETPQGIESIEGRVAVDQPGTGLYLLTDWTYNSFTYAWAWAYNYNTSTYLPYLETHYNDESVDGVFSPGKMWSRGLWTDLNNAQGTLSDPVPCPGLYGAPGRIAGIAGTAKAAKGGPDRDGDGDGEFLPTDGMMTLAILSIVVPADIDPGVYNLSVCDWSYTDQATGDSMPMTPGDALILEIVPEPTAALLLIAALPFLRRRR